MKAIEVRVRAGFTTPMYIIKVGVKEIGYRLMLIADQTQKWP